MTEKAEYLSNKFIEWAHGNDKFESYSGFYIPEVLNFIDLNFFEGKLFDFDSSNIDDVINELETKVYDNTNNNKWDQFRNIGRGSPRALLGRENYLAFLRHFFSVENNRNEFQNIGSLIEIQKIFYGAPGTGKSHNVKEITKDAEIAGRVERITFHPEYDHASFVGSYKPTMNGDDIRYEFVSQAFTDIYVKAWNDPQNKYFLIIEEINRGNCSEIFGDIFQLLDRKADYDITPSKELKEFLHNNTGGLIDTNFGLKNGKLKLPSNLNILATMNTSDQSLFPMDSAFKRRWDWEYIPINYDKDEDKNESAKYLVKLPDGSNFEWIKFIEEVNKKWISNNENLGMDKCIGNYFIKPDLDDNKISFKLFVNKVIFYLWNDVFKDEARDKSIFQGETTYESFFPLEPDGQIEVKKIVKDLFGILENTEE